MLAALAFVAAMRADASVVIAGTRVIYHQNDSEVTLQLSNVGTTPSLVQVWLDKGDAKASPSSVNVPFIVTPPVSRIDPQKSQTLRIVYTGDALPTDHESVFWLNVLDIPPKATGDTAGANKLQLAFRSRIKLFYRPAALKGETQDAPAQVTWHLTTQDGHPALEAVNQSAYDVSFTTVEVVDGSHTAVFDDGDMIRPGESKVLPLKGETPRSPSAKVDYHYLNDYGGAVEGYAPLR